MWMDTELLERLSGLQMMEELGIELSFEENQELEILKNKKEECLDFWMNREEPAPMGEFNSLIEDWE